VSSDRFEDALQEIAHRFAMEVVELIRTTTVHELAALARSPGATPFPAQAPAKPAKRRGTPPKVGTEAAAVDVPGKPARRRGRPPKAKATKSSSAAAVKAVAVEPRPPAAKPKKKRNWPMCSVPACGKKMYPGSGKNRLCYGHHLDAGGKQSPLTWVNQSRETAVASARPTATGAPVAEKRPQTVRRGKKTQN